MLRTRKLWSFVIALGLAAFAWPAPVSAQWTILGRGDHGKLKGKTIVDVGDLEERSERIGEGYHYDARLKREVWSSGQRMDWREFDGSRVICFPQARLVFRRQQALLLTDGSTLYLATLSGGGSWSGIEVSVEVAREISCPDR